MTIVALFDMSGYSVRDWAEKGETCYCLDIVNDGKEEVFESGGKIKFLRWDAKAKNAEEFVISLQPSLIISFPPCTDLASSGAAHFASKRKLNPRFQEDAMELVLIGPKIGQQVNCHWLVENPVGVLSTKWKSPNWYFDPCQFGGYLLEDDIHPLFPQYISKRDAYTKTTCIWQSKELKKPRKKSVGILHLRDGWSNQASQLGGKSARTKMIRSLTPRGFARAFFETNYSIVTGKSL